MTPTESSSTREHAVQLSRLGMTGVGPVFRATFDRQTYTWTVHHPDPDVAAKVLTPLDPPQPLRLGDWDGPIDKAAFGQLSPDDRGQNWTWAQYAAHQWGQVLRQRDLLARLKALHLDQLGRREVAFGWDRGEPVSRVFHDLRLSFNELDALLSLAEGRGRGEDVVSDE